MSFSLASISRTKHEKAPRIILHGVEKIGKSTFFANSDNPIFIRTEDGLGGLSVDAFPLCQSFQDAIDQLYVILKDDHKYRTLVIDSADWLEKLVHKHVCERFNVTNIELAAGGYGKGYIEANNHWRDVLSILDQINAQRKMYIGIICHSKIVTVANPEHEAFDMAKMKLHSPKSGNGANEMLLEWGDIIGYCQREIFVRQRETSTSDNKSYKAVSTNNRFLHLEGAAGFQAGNRYSLPPKIELSWAAFQSALFADIKSQQSNPQPAANDQVKTEQQTA